MTAELSQFRIVLFCLILGIISGFLFLGLKFVRLSFNIKKIGTVALDVLFSILAGFIFFLGTLALGSGSVRYFQVLLELIGAFCVILSFDRLVERLGVKSHSFCHQGEIAVKRTFTKISANHKIRRKKRIILRKKKKSSKKAKKEKQNSAKKT